MKKYLIPQSGKFYKANMHMHTVVSDGRLTPEETKELYMKEGYSIVAFSDHEVLIPENQLTDENFLALTATELSVNEEEPKGDLHFSKSCHLSLISKDPYKDTFSAFSEIHTRWLGAKVNQYIPESMKGQNPPRQYSPKKVQELIDLCTEEGFLVCLNHPAWSTLDFSDWHNWKGLWAVEVSNSGSNLAGYPDNVQPLVDLLFRNQRVYPIAADDAHSDFEAFGGWLMVKAEKLEYGTVMDALERGDFYASTGPTIHELTLEDGILHVSCSDAAQVFVNTERREAFIKRAGEAPLNEVDIDLNTYFKKSDRDQLRAQPYFRVTVVDARGLQAWTRAYFLDELNLKGE